MISFSHKELGVTQSLHGNVYKVMNYKGQVTLCNYFCVVRVGSRLEEFVYTELSNHYRLLKGVT